MEGQWTSPTLNPQLPQDLALISSERSFSSLHIMEQKVVLKVMTMTDNKTKQKAIEAAADIFGVDAIVADMNEQKLTVIGQMDTVAVVKRLKKVGKVDIVSVGPAKEEKKEEKEEVKEEPKEEKKEEEKK